MKPQVIELWWVGPFRLEKAIQDFGEQGCDQGLYQVYGDHPTYGRRVLLYIGQTRKQTFRKRLAQEKWEWTDNPGALEIHLGRPISRNPGALTDEKLIDAAERLVIFAHKPAWNSSRIASIKSADLAHVHLLNWGTFGSLQSEISGIRWTSTWPTTNCDGCTMPSPDKCGERCGATLRRARDEGARMRAQ